jgi:valyl-tRNA synthetase
MTETTMPKTYDFASTEQRLYDWWWKSGWFKPEAARDQSAEPFVISIPPPNVTGELHWGHAMFVSVEDLMIRYARMKGYRTLWVPGMDHAGIATQLQVEKLLRSQGLSKEEVGREEFVKRAWDWKAKYGGIIQTQIRRLGASCDWDRERFTLDEGLSRAVREAFVRLYDQGLIYRGTRLVNWSPGLKTAVSDIEVEYSEEDATLYYFKYYIKGTDGYLPVATIRPETILGDTAVAVHPADERYNWLIGKTAIVPILNREIPVIGDEKVDREFGGGALKITPGHDPIDYEIALRHQLPIINILTLDAKINENGGPYAGLDRFEARQKFWADMEAAGMTIKTEPYHTSIPRAQRGGEIIEPMMSTQWYVKIKPLAEKAYRAVEDGRIKIIPERFEKVYYNWMNPETIKDWCISRQLWWGHRIPVWTCEECNHEWAARIDPTDCPKCHSHHLRQDPDVLDTWFSSGLWPFSTLGWPDETPDLKTYYPTSVMETGYDILFFWVARMIMQGLEMTGQVPFHTVYLHGLVRDEHGRKFSKSLGNTLDPVEIINEFGTDAFRFTLLTMGTPGNDLNIGLSRVEANRNFANKIWNAARYVISNLEIGRSAWKLEVGKEIARLEQLAAKSQPPTANYSLPDRWILSRLNQTIASVTRLMDNYEFGEAGRQAYDFLWGEYADWYIEMSKIPLNSGDRQAQVRTAAVLMHVLDRTLRLLHPFIPFVTEEIWQNLKKAINNTSWGEALIIAEWPRSGPIDPQAEADMTLLMDAVRAIRNARAERNVEAGKKLAVMIASTEKADLFESLRAELAFLARLDPAALYVADRLKAEPKGALPIVTSNATIYLPLAQMIDLAAERERLGKEMKDLSAQIERITKLLGSDFANKAPGNVVQKERDRLADFQTKAEKLRDQIERLG